MGRRGATADGGVDGAQLSTTEQKEMEDFKKKQEETMNTLDADLEQKKAMVRRQANVCSLSCR